MLKELVLSVVSGIIVAVILQLFGRSSSRSDAAPRQTMRSYNYAPAPRRRSFFGRFVRLILAVGGGIALAQIAAPFFLRRRYRDFDGGFNDFDGLYSIQQHLPMIALTVVGTIIVYMVLSAMTRR